LKVLYGGPDQTLRISKEEKARTAEEEIMDSAVGQCTSPQGPCCEAVFFASKSIPVLKPSLSLPPIHWIYLFPKMCGKELSVWQ
jgi:hypothetical protein